jgi:hypothetical protein
LHFPFTRFLALATQISVDGANCVAALQRRFPNKRSGSASKQAEPALVVWLPKTKQIAIRVLDCELDHSVKAFFPAPLDRTPVFDGVPNGHNIININALRCGGVRASRVVVVHKHYGDVITNETTPFFSLCSDAPKSQRRTRTIRAYGSFHWSEAWEPVLGIAH